MVCTAPASHRRAHAATGGQEELVFTGGHAASRACVAAALLHALHTSRVPGPAEPGSPGASSVRCVSSSPKPALTPLRSGFQSSSRSRPSCCMIRSPCFAREHQRDGLDLPEEVEVRSQGGDGAVEEYEVLDEQHELLGHAARPSASSVLIDRWSSATSSSARQRRRVDPAGRSKSQDWAITASTSARRGRTPSTQGGHLGGMSPLWPRP